MEFVSSLIVVGFRPSEIIRLRMIMRRVSNLARVSHDDFDNEISSRDVDCAVSEFISELSISDYKLLDALCSRDL